MVIVGAAAVTAFVMGSVVEATGVRAYIKSNVGPGLDAWAGITRDTQTIIDELGNRAGETPLGAGGRRRQ